MVTTEQIEHMTYEGHLMKSADGGYPVVYGLKGGEYVCADCATEATSPLWPDGEVKENPEYDVATIVSIDTHLEGSPIDCDRCSKSIKSAHGDPDGCATCQELTTEGNAHNYAMDDDDGLPMYRDARDGDVVCTEHARFCVLCRQCFAPCQFENHLLAGDCPTMREPRKALAYLFPIGTDVLVSVRNVEGPVGGLVRGFLEWGGYIEVETALGTDTYPDWNVKRADIHTL